MVRATTSTSETRGPFGKSGARASFSISLASRTRAFVFAGFSLRSNRRSSTARKNSLLGTSRSCTDPLLVISATNGWPWTMRIRMPATRSSSAYRSREEGEDWKKGRRGLNPAAGERVDDTDTSATSSPGPIRR